MPLAALEGLPDEAKRLWESVYTKNKKEFGEERAAKMAWGAVKKNYHKKGDSWMKKKAFDAYEINTEKIKAEETDKGFFVDMFLTTSQIDNDSPPDFLTPECIKDVCNQIKNMPITLKMDHDHKSHPLMGGDRREMPEAVIMREGEVVEEFDPATGSKITKLKARARLNEAHPNYEKLVGSIKNGSYDSVSFEFLPLEWNELQVDGKPVAQMNCVKATGATFTGRAKNPGATIIGWKEKIKAELNFENDAGQSMNESKSKEGEFGIASPEKVKGVDNMSEQNTEERLKALEATQKENEKLKAELNEKMEKLKAFTEKEEKLKADTEFNEKIKAIMNSTLTETKILVPSQDRIKAFDNAFAPGVDRIKSFIDAQIPDSMGGR